MGQVPTSSGREMAEWVMKSRDSLNLKYVIWGQRIWNPSQDKEAEWTSWRGMEDRGDITQNHWYVKLLDALSRSRRPSLRLVSCLLETIVNMSSQTGITSTSASTMFERILNERILMLRAKDMELGTDSTVCTEHPKDSESKLILCHEHDVHIVQEIPDANLISDELITMRDGAGILSAPS